MDAANELDDEILAEVDDEDSGGVVSVFVVDLSRIDVDELLNELYVDSLNVVLLVVVALVDGESLGEVGKGLSSLSRIKFPNRKWPSAILQRRLMQMEANKRLKAQQNRVLTRQMLRKLRKGLTDVPTSQEKYPEPRSPC